MHCAVPHAAPELHKQQNRGRLFRNVWNLYIAVDVKPRFPCCTNTLAFAALWLDKPTQLNNVTKLFTKLVFQKRSESRFCWIVGGLFSWQEFFRLQVAFWYNHSLCGYYPIPFPEAGGSPDSMLTIHLNSLGSKMDIFYRGLLATHCVPKQSSLSARKPSQC